MNIKKKRINDLINLEKECQTETLEFFYRHYGLDLRKYKSPLEQVIAVHEAIFNKFKNLSERR